MATTLKGPDGTLGSRTAKGIERFKQKFTLRDAAILTGSYVDSDYHIDVGDYSQVALGFSITQGSLTSFEWKVFDSHDVASPSTWLQHTSESVAAGTTTVTPQENTISLSANVDFEQIVPTPGKWLKLQVKGTGTVTGSSAVITAVGVQ